MRQSLVPSQSQGKIESLMKPLEEVYPLQRDRKRLTSLGVVYFGSLRLDRSIHFCGNGMIVFDI